MEEQIIKHAQPFEISTSVSVDVDSKGKVKPSCKISISRKVEASESIRILVSADLEAGIENVTNTIDEIIKKYEKKE